MEKFTELSNKEMAQINGGGLIPMMVFAFGYGAAYGYVKEKLASGQW